MLLTIRRAAAPVMALVALTATVTSAQEAISNVRVLDANGASVTAKDGSYALPEGAKKASVTLDYNLGGSEDVGVTVVVMGVPSLVVTKPLTGQGTASFDITGDAIYRTVGAGALEAAQAALAAHGNAGLQKVSTMSYIEAIQTAMAPLRTTVPLLKLLKLDDAFSQSVTDLEVALSDFNTVVTGVQSAGTEEARKAKAADLKAPLTAAQQSATSINGRLAQANGMALPTTGNDNRTPIDVSIKRDGSSAESLQITVGTGSLVPAPTITKSSQSLTGAATATPGASGAQPQGQPTSASAGQTGGSGGQTGGATGSGSTGGTTGAAPVAGAGMAGGPLAAGSTAVPGSDPSGAGAANGAAVDPVMPADAAPDSAADAPGAANATPVAGSQVAQLERGAPVGAPRTAGSSSTGGSSGPAPNVAVIAIGALVLVGAALWLRRRM